MTLCRVCSKKILKNSISGLCKEHYVQHITGNKKVRIAKVCQHVFCNELIINSKNTFCNQKCKISHSKVVRENDTCPLHHKPFHTGFCSTCVENKRNHLIKKKIIMVCCDCGTQLYSKTKTKCMRCLYSSVSNQ